MPIVLVFIVISLVLPMRFLECITRFYENFLVFPCILRYFDEKSYEEIAEHLQIPIGTVKAKLFRAREFLLQLVRDCIELQ